MGRRRSNNPKVVNRGYTRDYPCLSVSDLRREDLLEGAPEIRCDVVFFLPDGEKREGILYVFNDEDGTGCSITLKRPYNPKGFKLVHIPRPFGGKRWYFQCPESGIRCSEVYWYEDRFAPRQVHRLNYASQGQGRLQRRLERRAQICRQLTAPPKNRPRGKKLERLHRELEAIDGADMEDLVRFAGTLGVTHSRDTAKARRTFLDIAVMSFGRDLKPEPPIFDESRLKLVKDLFPYPKRLARTLRWARNGPEIPDRLDASVLDRHGLLAPGTLWARTVDWSREDLGEFDLIIDARSDGPVAVMIQHPGEKEPAWQLYWIERFPAPFGRTEARFVCPESGDRCRDLFLAQDGLTPDLEAVQAKGSARLSNPKRTSGELIDCLVSQS